MLVNVNEISDGKLLKRLKKVIDLEIKNITKKKYKIKNEKEK